MLEAAADIIHSTNLMDILKTIRSTLYDPAFYDRVRSESIRPTLKIFAIVGVIGIGLTMVLAVPALVSFANSNFPDKIESAYPDDLVVNIHDGQMSINQPEPYYIKNTLPFLGDTKNLVVFDGTDQLSDDLVENSTIVLVKKKYMITPGQNHQQQILPLSQIATTSTTTIEKSSLVGIVDHAKPYFKPVVLIGGAFGIVLVTLLGALFWVLFHMMYLLFPALLIFFFTQLRGFPYTYKQSYIIAAYASIPVVILSYILFGLLLKSASIPFAYSLALLLVAIFNIVAAQKKPEEAMSESNES